MRDGIGRQPGEIDKAVEKLGRLVFVRVALDSGDYRQFGIFPAIEHPICQQDCQIEIDEFHLQFPIRSLIGDPEIDPFATPQARLVVLDVQGHAHPLLFCLIDHTLQTFMRLLALWQVQEQQVWSEKRSRKGLHADAHIVGKAVAFDDT